MANPPAPEDMEWDEAQKSQGKLKSLAECGGEFRDKQMAGTEKTKGDN